MVLPVLVCVDAQSLLSSSSSSSSSSRSIATNVAGQMKIVVSNCLLELFFQLPFELHREPDAWFAANSDVVHNRARGKVLHRCALVAKLRSCRYDPESFLRRSTLDVDLHGKHQVSDRFDDDDEDEDDARITHTRVGRSSESARQSVVFPDGNAG